MKCTVKTQRTITLELTEHEAAWLKHAMQNPLPTDMQSDQATRRAFWSALTDAENQESAL